MASPPDDAALDRELSAVFDDADPPDSPSAPSPPCIPPSPEPPTRAPSAPAPRTLLSIIPSLPRPQPPSARVTAPPPLSARASAAAARAPIHEAMLLRRASKRHASAPDPVHERARKRRRARNAFRVARIDPAAPAPQNLAYLDPRFANMSLRHARFPLDALEALFEHAERVDISEITHRDDDIRAGKLGEFVVFGCLVRKHAKKETKTGAKYAVWSLCNMPRKPLPGAKEAPTPTSVTLLLFEDAFQAFHTQVEGSVFALRKPHLLPPRGLESSKNDVRGNAEHSGHCLKVSNRDFIIPLGICTDYKLCEVEGPNMSVCGVWYDANIMRTCPYHMRKKLKKQFSGSRMDVNNAERPALAREVLKHLQDPDNISRQGGSRNNRQREEKELSDNQKWKMDQDRMKTQKLQAVKKKIPLSIASKTRVCHFNTVLKSESERKRQLPLARVRKTDIESHSRLAPQQLGACSKKQAAPTLQTLYLEAVDVLVRCGFVLGADGSLSPHASDLLKVKLRTSADLEQNAVNQGSPLFSKQHREHSPTSYAALQSSRDRTLADNSTAADGHHSSELPSEVSIELESESEEEDQEE